MLGFQGDQAADVVARKTGNMNDVAPVLPCPPI